MLPPLKSEMPAKVPVEPALFIYLFIYFGGVCGTIGMLTKICQLKFSHPDSVPLVPNLSCNFKYV